MLTLRKKCLLIAAAVLVSYTSLNAAADVLPAGARTPAPAQVVSAYVGRTDLWKDDCGGGVYYGPNSTSRAWCQSSPSGFAAGSWTVDQFGRMCQQLTWYWSSNGHSGSSLGDHSCINHVVDRKGRIWRNWPGDKEWWPLGADSDLVGGYVFQEKVLRAKRGMGI